MAKTKTAPTAAMLALLDARQKLQLAKDADAKASTDKSKAAVTAASKVASDADAIVRRERFVNVGGGRIKKARAAIRNFAAVAAPRSYQYDESDIAKAETAMGDEVKKAIAKMRASLVRGAAAAKAEDDFTF